ncbi:hypothetical protein ACFQ7J_05680 [Streptomyces sp. NPDC056501]|uniref:hypothetical protein n=1 Tax=Streptomyces sp. NPDC056501 TaxID=3345841 RepID=UPI0036C28C12
MGEITVSVQDMDHLLHDPKGTYGAPYQRAYAELAATHRGRPSAEIDLRKVTFVQDGVLAVPDVVEVFAARGIDTD